MRKLGAVTTAVAVAFAAACGQSGSAPSASTTTSIEAMTLGDSPIAQARVDALRARFQIAPVALANRPGRAPQLVAPKAVIGVPVATGFEKVDDTHFRALLPAKAKSAVTKPASVVLPTRAMDAVTLEDDTTHMQVKFALRGASEAVATVSKGMVVYPGALGGADVVHRVHAGGTEDYVVFESKPPIEELVYDVDVSRVAGLRLVSNTLEFLGADGSPGLRVAPPYAVDAKGSRRAATINVSGCAYDTNPVGPWGRAVTAPGAATCAVHVAWSANVYPAIVDPGWSTTGSLATARARHRATALASGHVLITGGLGLVSGSATSLASAELYDPVTGTFSATGSMATTRAIHTMTLLNTGKVLVTGGAGGTGEQTLSSAELYDPTAGTFSATGAMAAIREYHAATLLSSGKVLVTGGYGSPARTTAEIYDPTAATFSATAGPMTTGRESHTATLLSSGEVLVAGGDSADSSGTVLSSAELYNPATNTFVATGSLATARAAHTSTLLGAGTVLVAGGEDPGPVANEYRASAELYNPTAGTFSTTGSLAAARANHTATFIPSTGNVLIAGGENQTDGLASAEVYASAAGTFASTVSMAATRDYFTATLLGTTGKILVTGGQEGNSLAASAELYDPNDLAGSTACAENADCDSNFCVDGVCCNSACDDQCEACDVTGHVGTCTAISGAPHGSRAACATTASCTATCDGTNAKACTYAPSKCASTCSNGSETDSLCDTTGSCVAQSSAHSCNNLVCADTKTCKATCASDSDCLAGFTCDNGKCDPKAGSTCFDDHTAADPNGNKSPCDPYHCSAGACFQKCTSIADCLAPNVCDPSGQCVAPQSSGNSGGCNTSDKSSGDAAWVFLGLVALVVRRKKKCGGLS